MAIVLAVPRLFDLVVAKAASESTPSVLQVFGWRELAKHPTGPNAGTARRVVWVPGDDENGDLGELGPAKQPGRNPRPLATLDELVTVYLEAVNMSTASVLEMERAQYQAARELFDAWFRWLHLVAPGTFELKSSRWVISQKERRFGASIRVVLAVQAMVPDVVLSTIGTDARAEWTLEVSGNTETGSTTDAP
jgi:hypothetical protein